MGYGLWFWFWFGFGLVFHRKIRLTQLWVELSWVVANSSDNDLKSFFKSLKKRHLIIFSKLTLKLVDS